MLYFIDSAGKLQLTGSGFVVLILLLLLASFAIVNISNKILYYYRRYRDMEKWFYWIKNDLDKNFDVYLEKYYQKRKNQEKNNDTW